MSGIQQAAMAAGAGAAAAISISNETLIYVSLVPEHAYAGYRLDSDGKVYTAEGPGLAFVERANWVTPLGDAADFEVLATLSSGTLTGGATGLPWQPLTSDRSWWCSRTSFGTQNAVLSISIRDAATQTIQDTATISLNTTAEL